MDYCIWVWSHIAAFWIVIWQFIQPIFSSPFVAALLASILAPWFAIKTYLKQQRVSRIQRIYYEESLLDQLKHLDNAIDITSKNLAYFENAINFILNDFRMGVVTMPTITLLNDIVNKIKAPIRYHSSKREVLITLFNKYGYTMHQWLFKFDKDFSWFNLYIREVVFNLATRLQLDPNLPRETILNQSNEVNNNFNLVMRHYTFSYLFNQIVSRIGTLDFKSQQKLINDVGKDNAISSTLIKIDEAFKILFGYFKIDDKNILSYLKDENGDRFKFHINDQISIERVKINPPPADQMRIIKDDMQLVNVTIFVKNTQRNYSLIQTGMANLCAFDEKPRFYPEAESFNNFQ